MKMLDLMYDVDYKVSRKGCGWHSQRAMRVDKRSDKFSKKESQGG